MADEARGRTEYRRTVSGRCWSAILTREASEAGINSELMPALPYFLHLHSRSIAVLIYDIFRLHSGRFLIHCDTNTNIFKTLPSYFRKRSYHFIDFHPVSVKGFAQQNTREHALPLMGSAVGGCFPEIPGSQICNNYLILSACLVCFFFFTLSAFHTCLPSKLVNLGL